MTASTEAKPANSTRGPKPHISLLLATWFGLGYLPKAPGTRGSIGAHGSGVAGGLGQRSKSLRDVSRTCKWKFLDLWIITRLRRNSDGPDDRGDGRHRCRSRGPICANRRSAVGGHRHFFGSYPSTGKAGSWALYFSCL